MFQSLRLAEGNSTLLIEQMLHKIIPSWDSQVELLLQ